MKLNINDRSVELNKGITMADLLKSEGLYKTPGFAVAVNEDVIPRKQWDSHHLSDGDSILIINPTQGG